MNLIKTRIQFRRDSASNWELYKDIIPAVGEPCFVIDKNILKIGDGVTAFKDLKPINGIKCELTTDEKSLIIEDDVLKLMGFDTAEVGAQPRKNENGFIEWIVPAKNEDLSKLIVEVDSLRNDVTSLQTGLTNIQDIVIPSAENGVPLLTRIESLENKMDNVGEGTVDDKINAKFNEFESKVTDGNTIDTFKELVAYVSKHGSEVSAIVNDITALQNLVGPDSVHDQINAAIANSDFISKDEMVSTLLSKIEANTTFNRVKYEIFSKPAGVLVDYNDKEIRVLAPAGTKWVKQNVGESGNGNMYYMGFKAYAPNGAVSFKEGDQGVIKDEMLDFNSDFSGTDKFGRNYSIVWLPLASYDSDTNTWSYFGKNSTINKYIGWTYCVEWYDADGVVIESDRIRINLSNENCHYNVEPYYMGSVVKGVKFNGTLIDVIDGMVNIEAPAFKDSDEIAINTDGSLSIKSISFDKIIQSEDYIIVMDGGNAV